MFCQCQERHLNFARVYSYNYRRFPSYFPSSLFCRLEKKNISFCCLLRNLTLVLCKVEADLLYFLEKLNYKEKRDYCIKKISKFQFNRNYTPKCLYMEPKFGFQLFIWRRYVRKVKRILYYMIRVQISLSIVFKSNSLHIINLI